VAAMVASESNARNKIFYELLSVVLLYNYARTY
jgi:hypothetical protein